ncbi:hypothetical protein ACIPMU_35225 [Streptomyces cyaneofuscatus]|uniref:hypothetical protein n=1 Tax=Streptomyces cyaneofuscatus TaxID=66883 RepID=UPI0037F5AD54
MPASPFEPLADDTFLSWARHLGDRLLLGLGETSEENDLLRFLARVYVNNGEVPSELVAPMVQKRRITLARCYMGHFIGQARKDTGIDIKEAMSSSPPDDLEPTGLTQVGNSSIQGLQRPEVAYETAEAVQDYIMARYATVWPVCRTHNLGYHPVLANGTPAWECSVGAHRTAMFVDDPCATLGRH